MTMKVALDVGGVIYFDERAPLAHPAWLRVRDRWNDLKQPIPGSVEAVAALAERYAICVVANQPEECLHALDGLGLTGLFAEIALDSLVGYAKPDPALLAYACAGLAWDPADVLVVGNRLDHDVVPALALGCPVAFVLPQGGWEVPDWVHPDVAAVHRAVRPVRPVLPAHLEAKVGYVTADLAGLAAILTGDAGAGVTPGAGRGR